MIINGQFWNRRREAGDYAVTWHINEGQVETPLPAPFSQLDDLHVNASSEPYDTRSLIFFRYNGVDKQKMEFDKEEDQHVKR